jgi:hypothetical protein
MNIKLLTNFFIDMKNKDMIGYLHSLGESKNEIFDQNTCLILVKIFLNILECFTKEELTEIIEDMNASKIHALLTLHCILSCLNIVLSKKIRLYSTLSQILKKFQKY